MNEFWQRYFGMTAGGNYPFPADYPPPISGLNDYLNNGVRSAESLTPGMTRFRGDVMSTDSPSESFSPQLQRDFQRLFPEPGYAPPGGPSASIEAGPGNFNDQVDLPNPDIEPTAIPTYIQDFGASTVASGADTFGLPTPTQDDFNLWHDAPFYSPAATPSPTPEETPLPTAPGTFDVNNYDTTNVAQDTTGISPEPEVLPATGWPFYIQDFPSGDTSAPPPGGNMTGAGMPFDSQGNSLTINPSDPNNNLTRGGVSMPLYPTSGDVFPGASPSGFHPGQMIMDAAGNLVSSTGTILASAATIASKFGGSIANAAQTAGQRLAGITPSGYNTNLPGGAYYNAETGGDMGRLAAEGAFGHPDALGPNTVSGLERLGSYEGGRGGYFGSSTNYNPDIYSQRNPFGVGQVGSSSVQAPQGGAAPGSSMMNLSGTSMGNALVQSYLRRMYKGLYTSPQDWSQNQVQSPSVDLMFGRNTPGPITRTSGFNAFHQGQVELGNILRANPALFSQFPGGTGRGPNTGRGTPPVSPQ